MVTFFDTWIIGVKQLSNFAIGSDDKREGKFEDQEEKLKCLGIEETILHLDGKVRSSKGDLALSFKRTTHQKRKASYFPITAQTAETSRFFNH